MARVSVSACAGFASLSIPKSRQANRPLAKASLWPLGTPKINGLNTFCKRSIVAAGAKVGKLMQQVIVDIFKYLLVIIYFLFQVAEPSVI